MPNMVGEELEWGWGPNSFGTTATKVQEWGPRRPACLIQQRMALGDHGGSRFSAKSSVAAKQMSLYLKVQNAQLRQF